jgi:hypothetical protein
MDTVTMISSHPHFLGLNRGFAKDVWTKVVPGYCAVGGGFDFLASIDRGFSPTSYKLANETWMTATYGSSKTNIPAEQINRFLYAFSHCAYLLIHTIAFAIGFSNSKSQFFFAIALGRWTYE